MNKSYKDMFKSVAWYYACYRPGYPPAFYEMLKQKFGLSKNDRALDLGCGTGQIAIPISKLVKEAVGMDPEPEMLAEGKNHAVASGVSNIKWVEGGSEDLTDMAEALGKFKLVTIGTAFHWMNREKTLDALYELIVEGGGIVVAWYGNADDAHKEQPFHTEEIIKKYLGEQRRAGSGFYTPPPKRHEEVVKESKFRNMEMWQHRTKHVSNIDAVVGYTYSTSYSNPAVLGDKKEAFEKELRETLLQQNPSGKFESEGQVDAILAWK